jgi:hypothetical protein
MKRINISGENLEYLMDAYDDMGYDRDDAKEDLKELILILYNLPEPLILHRIIYLDEFNTTLNKEQLGDHYSYDKQSLIDSHYGRGWMAKGNEHMEGESMIITVKASKSQIDVIETLHNNILYPNEKEITLKEKGKGVKILDIDEL